MVDRVYSVLIYGCESWSWSQQPLQKTNRLGKERKMSCGRLLHKNNKTCQDHMEKAEVTIFIRSHCWKFVEDKGMCLGAETERGVGDLEARFQLEKYVLVATHESIHHGGP